VVDDRSSVRVRVEAAGGKLLPGQFLDFLDPWGNRIEVVEYANVQFTKAPHILRGMGLGLEKNDKARQELAEKGLGE
jgi:lactoylglutathione lyase